MTDERPPPTERTDLADLVRDRMAANNISLRTLAAAAIDPEDPQAGPLWTRSTLANLLVGGRVKPPRVPELRALAAGIALPLRSVQDAAAAQFFGMDAVYSPDEEVRTMVHHIAKLSPEDRRKIQALIDEFRNS